MNSYGIHIDGELYCSIAFLNPSLFLDPFSILLCILSFSCIATNRVLNIGSLLIVLTYQIDIL